MSRSSSRTGMRAGLIACALSLGACTGGMQDLEQYAAEVKERPGRGVEPLPEIKPYDSFSYNVAYLRSPFTPDTEVAAESGGGDDGIGPDPTRNREYLENFPLDSLRMVGTLDTGGRSYALIQDADGLIHRVEPGNYMGQSDGRITDVSASAIKLVEIVSDGLGSYMERPAAVALSE